MLTLTHTHTQVYSPHIRSMLLWGQAHQLAKGRNYSRLCIWLNPGISPLYLHFSSQHSNCTPWTCCHCSPSLTKVFLTQCVSVSQSVDLSLVWVIQTEPLLSSIFFAEAFAHPVTSALLLVRKAGLIRAWFKMLKQKKIYACACLDYYVVVKNRFDYIVLHWT